MSNRLHMNAAPKGLTNMSDHDDGLVHSHSWASSEAPRLHSRSPRAERMIIRPGHHHDHDDGLVHSHSWAVSSPER